MHLALVAGPLLKVPLAEAQEPSPRLNAHARSRLAEAARNPAFAPWQRELMREVSHRGLTGVAPRSSPVLADAPRRKAGTLADDGAWVAVPPPFERYWHTAVYDPVRDRMVVFGGRGEFDVNFNDVWALSLAGSPAWSMLVPAGSPPLARNSHTAIYDPVRDRIVVFGGMNDESEVYYNDVWALSLAGSPAWTNLTPAGPSPSARIWHTAIYDPVRDRMVVFGGFDIVGTRNNDVWALALAGTPGWSQLVPAGAPPAARSRHEAIYDPVRDRMVVLGGYAGVPGSWNEVWALSLAGSPAWSDITPAGGQPTGGPAIYDPASDRIVTFLFSGDAMYVWALSLAGSPAWSEIVPAGTPPLARGGHTAIHDPVRGRIVVFGGDNGYDVPTGLNDVWALSLEGAPSWSTLSSAVPYRRVDHTAIYDPLRHSMVVFGGYHDGFSDLMSNDVWSLSLAGSQGDWSARSTVGLPPAPRCAHTAIYDPVRDRMIVFGGAAYDSAYNLVMLNEVWVLSLADGPTWTLLAPEGSPPAARFWHTAIYDPVRDRMVVFGGTVFVNNTHAPRNDVWALSLAGSPAWINLDPVGSPPATRWGHTAIYDTVRDRMVVFVGFGAGGLNDAWELSLAGTPAWSPLAPAGALPSARTLCTAIYDPVRDRMVVFGGEGGPFLRNDAWALSLAGKPTWSALAPAGIQPTGRSSHAAVYDPARDRMVLFGGFDDNQYSNDVYALEWNAPLVSVPGGTDARRRSYEIAPPRPNPSRGATTVDFELAEPGRVVLEVLDIHGRRVRRLADEWFPAGGHASTWRGDDDRGRALGSGVYFIRIQGIGFEASRRIVRIR